MFNAFILLLQSLFCQGDSCYTEHQYEKAINHARNDIQAVDYSHATASYDASTETVTITTADGSIIVIDPSENN